MTQRSAGSMRTRATFERRTSAVGTRGQSSDNWYTLGVRDVEMEFLRGRKLELARELFARATVEVRMRKPFTFTLNVKDRAKIGDLILTIGSALPSDVKFDDLVLLCEVEQ